MLLIIMTHKLECVLTYEQISNEIKEKWKMCSRLNFVRHQLRDMDIESVTVARCQN